MINKQSIPNRSIFSWKTTQSKQDFKFGFYRNQHELVIKYTDRIYGIEITKNIIDRISNKYNFPKPTVKVLKSRTYKGEYIGGAFHCFVDRNFIVLPGNGVIGAVILHELSHYLEWLQIGTSIYSETYKNNPKYHSRLFIKIFNNLLKENKEIIGEKYSYIPIRYTGYRNVTGKKK